MMRDRESGSEFLFPLFCLGGQSQLFTYVCDGREGFAKTWLNRCSCSLQHCCAVQTTKQNNLYRSTCDSKPKKSAIMNCKRRTSYYKQSENGYYSGIT